MRSLFVIAMGVLLPLMPSAHAQTGDMAKLTCSDLSHADVADLVVLGSWLSGYYNAKRNNTVIDPKQLSANTQKVLQFCQTNPQMTAMQAIEQSTGAGH
jgi:HdeA/HdeB family